MASNTILHILHILEEYTDQHRMLSKDEILKKLQEEEYITLEEKAFYRKIDELKQVGYDVRSTKGSRTKYYLNVPRLSNEELLMLSAIILGSPDISRAEAEGLINTLYAMRVHTDLFSAYHKLKSELKTNNQDSNQAANQIQKFHTIYSAIDNKKMISCKIRLDNAEGTLTFSSRLMFKPKAITFDARHIMIECQAEDDTCTYPLCQMIDVELEE